MAFKGDKELLIDLVRNEPRLWDQRIKTYHNRDIKTDLWESIGKEFLIKGKYFSNILKGKHFLNYCLKC